MKFPVKKITHIFAVAAGLVYTFLISNAGQALAHQYPILGPIVGGLTTIGALYFSPKAARVLIIALFLSCSAYAQAPAPAPTQTHAIVKVAAVVVSPVVHPKRTLKQILGSVLFATENVVDVAHAGLGVADKVFDTVSIGGNIPILNEIYAVVSVGDKDTGKLDVWLERQEDFLFGMHN